MRTSNRKHLWKLPEAHSIEEGIDSLFVNGHDEYMDISRDALRARVEAIPLRLLDRYASRAEAITADMVKRARA